MSFYDRLIQPEQITNKQCIHDPSQKMAKCIECLVKTAQQDTLYAAGRLVGWDFHGSENIADILFDKAKEIGPYTSPNPP